MEEDVIKNKNRDLNNLKNQSQNRIETEYNRLGKIPIPYNASSSITDNQKMQSFDDEDDIVDYDNINSLNFCSCLDGESVSDNEFDLKDNNVCKDIPYKVQDDNIENNSPKVGEYILMIFGELLLCGSKNQIQNEIEKIIYKQHPKYQDTYIRSEDIIVLKRIELKVGVFFNE